MWSSVVVLALPIALDPVRLGVNLLLISRPKPAQNLLAYWLGCALASFVLLLVPILVLHFTPTFSSFVHDLSNPATTASSTVLHAEILLGGLAVAVAAVLALRIVARRRAPVPAGGDDAWTPPAEPDRSNPVSRLLSRPPAGEGAGTGSGLRRLLHHARSAWERGHCGWRSSSDSGQGPTPPW